MKFLLLLCLCVGLSFPAQALTMAERKMVQQAQVYVRQGEMELQQTKDALIASDDRANAAEQTVATTSANLAVAKKQIDDAHNREVTLAASNAKMKPVYDQCTKYWGLGAIEYGFNQLIKHLLITAIVIGVVLLGLYITSFFFPLIGTGLAIVLRIFRKGFSAVGAVIKNLVKALEAHLKPKPKPVYEGS